MKKTLPLLFLGALGLATAAQANVCQQYFGSLVCGPGNQDSITFMGNVNINGTTVAGKTFVGGILDAKNGNLNSLQVNGPTKLAATVVNADAQINGPLTSDQAKYQTLTLQGPLIASSSVFNKIATINGSVSDSNSKFMQPVTIKGGVTTTGSEFNDLLTIYARDIYFNSAKTKDIIDVSDDLGIETYKIYLQNGTVVDGSITFRGGDSNKHLVYLQGNSKITGQVINGKVVRDSD